MKKDTLPGVVELPKKDEIPPTNGPATPVKEPAPLPQPKVGLMSQHCLVALLILSILEMLTLSWRIYINSLRGHAPQITYISANSSLQEKIIFFVAGFGSGGPKSFSDAILDGLREISETTKIVTLVASRPYANLVDLFAKEQCIKKYMCLVWCQGSCFLQEIWKTPHLDFASHIFFGPNIVPIFYSSFPQKQSIESRWAELLGRIGGYIVHTGRVANHLASRSATNRSSYVIMSACYRHSLLENLPTLSNLSAAVPVLPREQRETDVLFYLKFADEDRRSLSKRFLEALSSSSDGLRPLRVVTIEYGHHNASSLLSTAARSKVVVYFSFWDTGAISLIEMGLTGPLLVTMEPSLIQPPFNGFALVNFTDVASSVAEIRKAVDRNFSCAKLAQFNQEYYRPKNVLLRGIQSMQQTVINRNGAR